MKTLDEFNEEKRRDRIGIDHPMLNGISCPKCGKAMMDFNGRAVYSIPLKIRIVCSECGHIDHRLL